MKVLSLAKLNLVLVALFIGLLPPNAFAQQQAEPTKEAAKALSEGIEAYNKGDYNTALISFTTATKLDPTFSEAYYRRGRLLDEIPWLKQERLLQEISRVPDDYALAIKFNPANADAYLRRGLRATGKSAIEHFDVAIRLRPDFAEAYYHRGVARSQEPVYWLRRIHAGGLKQEDLKIRSEELGTDSQKMDEVIAHLTNNIRSTIPDLTRSTELNPQYVEAHSYLALLYLVIGEYDNAVARATRVLALSPDNADAYYRRGLAYLELKQYEKANQDFTEVIRVRPTQTRAYSNRIIARFYLNDFDAALKDYVGLLRLKPSLPTLMRYADEVEMRDGKIVPIELEDFDRISPELAKTVRASLADTYYERAVAILYGETRKPDEQEQKKAVADLSRVTSLHPSHVRAHYEKGLTLCDLGLYTEAVKAFSDVIRLQPKNPEAYYARGAALRRLRLNRRALQDLSRSIKLSPKFTKAYFERARVYSELRDQRRAIADFTTAITFHAEFVDAYYLRGLAHEAVGENQKAIADYLQVARLAYPDEKTESDQTERLGATLATVFHRGVARLYLARLLNEERPFLTSSEESAKTDYLESAERDFTQVITAQLEFANAYRQRGRAREIDRVSKSAVEDFYGKGKKGALADFTKAIEVNPRYIDAYFSRAEQFDFASKAEAIRDYKRIIELDPGNAKAFYGMAQIYVSGAAKQSPAFNAAIENYSLAIKADPGYVAAYFGRARLVQEQKPLQALADYTQIIQLEPDNVDAYRGRAAVHKRLKDYRSSLADYTRAIELDPSEPGGNKRDAAITYAERAYVRFELGDGKGALEDYRWALIIRPCLYCVSGSGSLSQANKADAFFQKGLALLRRGDKEASRKNLEEAARLFYTQGDMPKYQNVKYHLSRF